MLLSDYNIIVPHTLSSRFLSHFIPFYPFILYLTSSPIQKPPLTLSSYTRKVELTVSSLMAANHYFAFDSYNLDKEDECPIQTHLLPPSYHALCLLSATAAAPHLTPVPPPLIRLIWSFAYGDISPYQGMIMVIPDSLTFPAKPDQWYYEMDDSAKATLVNGTPFERFSAEDGVVDDEDMGEKQRKIEEEKKVAAKEQVKKGMEKSDQEKRGAGNGEHGEKQEEKKKHGEEKSSQKSPAKSANSTTPLSKPSSTKPVIKTQPHDEAHMLPGDNMVWYPLSMHSVTTEGGLFNRKQTAQLPLELSGVTYSAYRYCEVNTSKKLVTSLEPDTKGKGQKGKGKGVATHRKMKKGRPPITIKHILSQPLTLHVVISLCRPANNVSGPCLLDV